MLELDKILEKCGDYHRLQAIMLLLFCIINLLSALHYYSQTIISFVPKYWCIDGYTNPTDAYADASRQAGSSCLPQRFAAGIDDDAMTVEMNVSAANLANLSHTCQHFDYELYMGYQSFTSELNWICDRAWQVTLGQAMFFVGSVVGSLLFGFLADSLGRLPILIAANVVAMVGNSLTVFGTTLPTFSFFRFLSGMATDSNFVMMYILVMEYLRPSLRTVGLSICIGFFYCLGSMAAPWIAVLLHTWRGFLLATSAPFAIVPLFYFIVPESVQWLISKQKYDKAVQCLMRVAKINGRTVDESVYTEFIDECKRSQLHTKSGPNLFGLFVTPRLRRNTLILFFKSMVITLCYDAVSRNVQGLGISPFVMFTLSATAILPACILLIVLQDRIGRKAMASMSLLLSGVFISVTGAILFCTDRSGGEKDVLLVVVLSVIGRFGVTVAYNSGAQYATELIPTCVRGQGVAVVHVMGYAFTFFSSYILYTRSFFQPMPEIILGILSLLGAGLCLLLPETLNRTLPTSLEDGENFGKNERWYNFSFLEQRTQSVDVLAANAGSQSIRDNGAAYF
ncbi:organic cation transporter protein isoform X1 [Ceratitis capitata]|uniref:organic cation transporter protein isoform X1 n=1 Tax=Ceratitis capitata TaxID=7213 RepID=UPI000329CA7C|nr:organic cation transporter protein isoform X1 [Ceratitis capitata]XP_020715029.1 organic cation transporter protein isoform X1 [Ceratitis capitata]XP_020715033.1 organic cation transporter protein isoform X1 [Ceratitis capitata]XP_020715034.1 organic cation transporter protein isoform X1 [Ceratitis capitata]